MSFGWVQCGNLPEGPLSRGQRWKGRAVRARTPPQNRRGRDSRHLLREAHARQGQRETGPQKASIVDRFGPSRTSRYRRLQHRPDRGRRRRGPSPVRIRRCRHAWSQAVLLYHDGIVNLQETETQCTYRFGCVLPATVCTHATGACVGHDRALVLCERFRRPFDNAGGRPQTRLSKWG